MIGALARYRFQKLDPGSDSIFDGLEKRRQQSLDAGFTAAALKGRMGELNLEMVTDTLDRHNGQEIEVSAIAIPSGVEPGFSLPFIGWGWQSDNLANYYFGVSEAEATPDRPAYDVGETQFLTLGLNTSWQLNDRILLFGNIGSGGLGKEVENSPIVDKANFNAAFIGGTYMFGNVLTPTAGEDRVTEWSWRVNYGYQADGNIVSEIDQGDFSKSTVVDTNIGGITFSRLLTDGKRVDYLGKIAFMRHFEEGCYDE